MKAILGKKIGMTSLFTEDGTQVPCTVIQAGPCPVIQLKRVEKDGYDAVKVGFGEIKESRINKPDKGQFKKIKIKPLKFIREFRGIIHDINTGDSLTVGQFSKGDRVKVSGVSKGRGFQGVVKRHHFGGVGMSTHGQSDRERAPGSLGQSSWPSRVYKGIRMAGRMGGKRATVRNIEVVEVLSEQNILLLKGSVPGAPDTLLEIIKL